MTYGWETTTDELLEGKHLSGQRILITGGSAGLGAETARALAAHGAKLVIAVRELAKGERAAEPIRAGAPPNASVELIELDLASLASTRACADRLLAEGKPLDVLIANAGVMACPPGTTAEGFETQFGTNHLGHFVFVNRLVPLVVAGAPSRIVALSSSGHRMSDVDLRRSRIRADAVRPVGGLRPLENCECALRRGARPASTRAGRPRVRGPPGRHPDRAGAPFNPGDVAAPHAALPYARATQVQVGAAGRGDVRLGRRCRYCRRCGRPLL